ncbi:metaxin-1 isoform X2 [Chrysoperla carnea]|uniref:metaxin-1 isoform X2 n=1 Tax=Chrysoperla carnea TaxID=189513 RepID=UPI001D098D9D|nr:metaxin-1 isoform X2 [Chrysoperla carnea]
MSNNSIMRIETWKGDWGIPSIDYECLQALALIKFSNAPVQNKQTNNPFWSSKNTLPIFRHDTTIVYDFNEIQNYLKKQGFDCDAHLNKIEQAEITAYINLIKFKLEPALNYVWWLDERNYTELFRKWYAKALPFPLNYYYPGYYEGIAKNYVDAMFPDVDKKDVIETSLFGEAEKCITTLSSRLGSSKYMFGNTPTSLDAAIYGHLAPLLKAPLLSTFLQNHLKACSNLEGYIDRITKEWFRVDEDFTKPTTPKPKPNPSAKSSAEEDFPHATRNKLLASIIATVAMLGYAVIHGMLPMELELTPEEIYEDEEQ